VKRGETVRQGHLLADVHARDEASAALGVEAVLAAYELGDTAPHAHGIVLDVIE
jgi:thymidine phosphorylase